MTPEVLLASFITQPSFRGGLLFELWEKYRGVLIRVSIEFLAYVAIYIVAPVAILVVLRDPRLFLPYILSLGLLGSSLALAIRKDPPEAIALVSGLAFGGRIWLDIVIANVPGSDLLRFLREHAFDYFSAGAIIAVVSYFAAATSARVRVSWLAGTIALIAGLAAFATGTGIGQTALLIVGGAMAGAALGAPGLPAPLRNALRR